MKILCFSLSLSEHTLPSNASIPNSSFVKAGGMDLSFLIIMLSMFLVAEKEKTLNSEKKKKRSERYCHMLFRIPRHAFKTIKAQKNVSSYLLFVSSCRYLISYAT